MRFVQAMHVNCGQFGLRCKFMRVDTSRILCTIYNMYMDAWKR
jgi:hypothetical protein